MKTVRTLAILGAVAALAVSVDASADIHRRHGSVCAPKHTSVTVTGVDERGIYNNSANPELVTCIARDERRLSLYGYGVVDARVSNITVNVNDLSTTSPFSCYVFGTAEDGFSAWGPKRYTCSNAGGCIDPTTAFTGIAHLSFNTSTVQGSGLDFYGVVCTLPPSTAAGASYVKSLTSTDAILWGEDAVASPVEIVIPPGADSADSN